MNGTIFDEIKKNGDSKRKEKIKFIFSLISTNLMVALLCFSLKTSPPENISLPTPAHALHPHYKMIVTPLSVLVDQNSNLPETPITLLSKSKKIIIQKAYLHEEVSAAKELGAPPRFKIEIPEDEILKLSADSSDLMIAIPEVKILSKEKPLKKRVSQYEVNL